MPFDRIAPPGDAVPHRGNALSRFLGRWALKIAGWKVEGTLPNLPKFVIIAAPHTSNIDFFLGVATLFAVGFRASWLGKASLFRWPIGAVLRWLGGTPVDRFSPRGAVQQILDVMATRDQFILALAPEGTRRKVEQWRTGFWHVAEGAGIPVVLGYFDYGRRVVGFGPAVMTTGDLDHDIAGILSFYQGVTPRYPAQF